MRERIIVSKPKAYLVGVTQPLADGVQAYLTHVGAHWNQELTHDDPSEVVEFGGRICYGSWSNPAHRTTEEYVQRQLIGADHVSVLYHAVFNLALADVARSTQLEIVRHHAGVAHSWESQRFTDARLQFVLPPAYRGDELAIARFEQRCALEEEWYRDEVHRLKRELGSRYEGTLLTKRIKEAARSILPNAARSDGLVSFNAQALRFFVGLRSSEAADLSIREVACAVFECVGERYPALFGDGAALATADGHRSVAFGG